jgi:hypothetical protein
MRTAQGGTLVSSCSSSTDQPNASPCGDAWAKTESDEAKMLAMVENRMIHDFGREFKSCRPRPGVCGRDS